MNMTQKTYPYTVKSNISKKTNEPPRIHPAVYSLLRPLDEKSGIRFTGSKQTDFKCFSKSSSNSSLNDMPISYIILKGGNKNDNSIFL